MKKLPQDGEPNASLTHPLAECVLAPRGKQRDTSGGNPSKTTFYAKTTVHTKTQKT